MAFKCRGNIVFVMMVVTFCLILTQLLFTIFLAYTIKSLSPR